MKCNFLLTSPSVLYIFQYNSLGLFKHVHIYSVFLFIKFKQMASYYTHSCATHFSLPSIEYTRCVLSIFFTITNKDASICIGLPKLESWVKGYINF